MAEAVTSSVRSRPAEADHYAAIVASSDDAILSKNPEGVITTWNPAAQRLYGYSPAEAIGQHISILIPKHRAGEEREILTEVMGGGRIDHYETERVRKDGTIVTVSVTVSPIRTAAGEIVSASVIARDIGEQRRARELAGRLQSVTEAFSSEITPERANQVLLEQAVAGLGADAGAIGIADRDSGEVELAASTGYSPAGLTGWDRFPLDADLPMSEAIRTGRAIWTSNGDELKERFPLLAQAQVRFGALAVIPLSVEGKRFGAISLSFNDARSFGEQERAFLVAATQQAAHALERSRLYDAERTARRRLAFLAAAGELLAESLDPATTMRRFADLAVSHLADWCAVEVVEDDGELSSVAVAHKDPERVKLAEELRAEYATDPDSEQGVPNVVRTGRSELYAIIGDEMLEASAQDAEHLRKLRQLGLVSAMVVPLIARGKPLGAITFVSSDPGHLYTDADVELAEDLARRAALAFDNATLFHREHEAAVTLQRALLPKSLPEVDGLDFAVRYDPAGVGLHVGGDWYEILALEDNTIALTIGDVAGRGIRAASVMGAVSPALRTLVLDGRPLEEALTQLNRQMKEDEPGEMLTLLHLRFHPGAGVARYVRAGHPPALLRRPDGAVVELGDGGAPPLGVFVDLQCQGASVEVPPGSLLLLYTDGLIERRDTAFDVGLTRLKKAFQQAPDDPQECLDTLAAEFKAEEISDDVAMLAMRVQ